MPQSRQALTVGLPIVALALGWQLGIGYARHEATAQQPGPGTIIEGTGTGITLTDPRTEADLEPLWTVWDILNSNYISPDKLTDDKLVLGATRGLVEAVGDPYTVFMDAKENTDFRQSLSGELQGIGAELSIRDSNVVIVAPIKGSPAQRAGLLPDDVILSVNKEFVEGKSLQDVVAKIRGEKGTPVTLMILRRSSSEPFEVTITREEIRIPSTEFELKTSPQGTIGYLSINQFGERTVEESREALETIRTNGNIKGLIVDLRFNGGGYLDGAIGLASLFQGEGEVVSVARRSGQPQRHIVTGNPLLPDLPMVVLINQGTASASEIVAGALQDHKRATIIGTQSFGKGTVQEVIDLPGGSSLRVTVARWLTPGGRDLGKEGVHPDFTVQRSEEDYETGRDPQLDAALDWLRLGKKPVQSSSSASSASKASSASSR